MSTLSEKLEQARQWMSTHGVAELSCSVTPGDCLSIAYWTGNTETGWGDYLNAVKALGAVAIATDITVLDEGEVDAAAALLRTIEEQGKSAPAFASAIRTAKAYVNAPCKIDVTTLLTQPPLAITLSEIEPWYEVLQELSEDAETEGDLSHPGEDVSLPDVSSYDNRSEFVEVEAGDQHEELARELAQNEAFQRTSTGTARIFLARRILGEKIPPNMHMWSLCNLALAIYELEIKPEQDLALSERARVLLSQGQKRTSIAATLGISTNKLAKLLGPQA